MNLLSGESFCLRLLYVILLKSLRCNDAGDWLAGRFAGLRSYYYYYYYLEYFSTIGC